MTNSIAGMAFLQRESTRHMADDIDSRGRTRDRSLSRANIGKPLRPDDASTLRGRSRQRAASPRGLASRNTSPSIGAILHYRLRGSQRREHCPSRPASSSAERRQSSPRRRQQRARSRSRKTQVARAVAETMMLENQQQQPSSLRNEILITEEPIKPASAPEGEQT